MAAHPLVVKQIVPETKDVVTIVLEVPVDLEELFSHKAGQYLTIEHPRLGADERQAYSISSSPNEPHLSITVKKVNKQGLSAYLNHNIKVGDTLLVSPPKGRLIPKINPDNRQTYYFIGAGSGITPLYSIIKTLLEEEPLSTIHLLYGSRSFDEIIYRQALIDLTEKYADQFFVRFQLSQDGERPVLYENRTSGRITSQIVSAFLEDYPKQTSQHSFFICGPQPMIENTQEVLLDLGISKNDIFVEQFNNSSINNQTETKTAMSKSCQAHISLDGNEIDIEITDQSILQTLLDAGYDPPFSCTSGVCTTCMAKLTKGTVEMEENYGLDESEVAKGFILTCQSHPTSDEIEVTYDV